MKELICKEELDLVKKLIFVSDKFNLYGTEKNLFEKFNTKP